MDEDLKEIVSRLKIAHSGTLVSIIVYGSTLIDKTNLRKDELHILVVTTKLSAEELRAARPVAKWWVEASYNLPVYFTEKEFKDSLDVFAIEFRQMKRAYRVLHGADLLANNNASKKNLRLQTEYELRGKLLRLRSLYLPSSESPENLLRLMTDSIYSFVQFFRPILELLNEEQQQNRLATVKKVGELLKIDTSSLARILQLREQQLTLTETESNHLFASYVDCLTQVIEAVNSL